jgi:membrane protease YdiL (CAAX protease family)
MLKGLFTQERTLVKLLILAGLVFFGLLAGIVLAQPFVSEETVNDAFTIRWTQLLMSICAFVFPAVSCAFLFKQENKTFWQWEKIPAGSIILTTGLSILFLIPFINFLAWLNSSIHFPEALAQLESILRKMGDEANQVIEMLLISNSTSDLLQNLFVLALVPAISEELLFRGTLQKILGERLNVHVAVWITAIIFSAFHMEFFGFVPRVLLGAFLGYLFVWSGSLYLSMVAHFVNNAFIVFAGYLVSSSYVADVEIDDIGTGSMWSFAVVSLLISLLLIYQIRKAAKQAKDSI